MQCSFHLLSFHFHLTRLVLVMFRPSAPTAQEHCGGSGATVWKEDEVLQLVQDSCGSEKNW